MSSLKELYQEVILDHNKRPRNFHVLEDCEHQAEGYNPLCGDRVTVYLHLDGDTISDISFQGAGCAISQASASLMTEALKGASRQQARELFDAFHGTLTSPRDEAPATDLGKLEALTGVKDYPMRIKCATLPWHTLQAALRSQGEGSVSTE